MSTPSTASSPSTVTDHLVRVEKGQANDEELAAVTALLLARAAARHSSGAPSPRAHRSKAGWRRLERQHGFSAPHSWQR